jgi:methionyl aminopeptidase
VIQLKTKKEIKTMAQGGLILSDILDELEKSVEVGVSGKVLDEKAQELARKFKVVPSFFNYAPKGHKPYPAALCVSNNQAVVHGLPNDISLEEGDIVGIDMGIEYMGLFLDSARTIGVGEISEKAKKLISVTKESLELAIKECVVGNTVGDIGAAVQALAEKNGFEVVRSLVGHGVGYGVHEEPAVPNYGERGKGQELQEGLVIAIEPMLIAGGSDVVTSNDGWTVEAKDGALAAHEEHTIAITQDGPLVLTKR